MKSPPAQSFPTARIFRTFVLAACGSIFLSAPCLAELVTFSASGRATAVTGTKPELIHGGGLGSTLKVSFTWDSNTLPSPQGGLSNFTNYFPAPNTVTAKGTFGDMTFEGLGNFYLGLASPYGIDTPKGDLVGDYAFLASSNTPFFDQPRPEVAFYAQLLFPADSFTGGATLPDLSPIYGNLAFQIFEDETKWVRVEAINVPFAPVPEPATYGALASMALIGLAVWRRFGDRASTIRGKVAR